VAVHLHDVTFVALPLGEHASGEGGNLDGDLVRLELDERVASGDRLALFLEPARYGRFDDRLAEGRDFDCGHEGSSRSESRRRCRLSRCTTPT
jgi:hypothetical protein